LPVQPRTRARTRWAGVPAGERRAERRELLLDAAFELLGTEGWSATTVRAVCTEAQLNFRYFYESFADLDELLVALYDRLVAELGEQVVEAMAAVGDDPAARLRAAIDRTLAYVDDDARRGRVLYVEALGSEPLNRRRLDTAHAVVASVEEQGAKARGGAGDDGVGRIAAAILVGGLSELVVAWLDGRIDVPRERLVDVATELFTGLGAAASAIVASRGGGTQAGASPGTSGRPR
jgi:AcrR family transcriptional regulator